jgi:hypothetical protein
MTAGAPGVFGSGPGKDGVEDFAGERTQLHAKIGQLSVELDWLTKKSKQLGL